MDNQNIDNSNDDFMKRSKIVPGLGLFCFICGAAMVIVRPHIGKPIYLEVLVGIIFIIISINCFAVYLSDIWFAGNRFDRIYKDRIFNNYKNELKFNMPYVRYFPKNKSFRTMVY